ncbi:MAG: 4Fe-4S binding protein, partial [Caldilineaceae bacterium]|nr:4Fe-4S binding protein [Caldilineaceae bacterium]
FFGATFQIVVLALVLIVALFVKRPWCTYLCPIHPIVEFIRIMRQWTRELWEKALPKTKTAS